MLRLPLWHRLLGVAGLLLGALTALMVAAETRSVARALSLAVGFALCVVAWRFWRLQIQVCDEGIVVVNWGHKARIPWSAIQRFSWDSGLTVLMRDGTFLIPDAYSPRVLPVTGQLDSSRVVAGRRLQDELRRHRHTT